MSSHHSRLPEDLQGNANHFRHRPGVGSGRFRKCQPVTNTLPCIYNFANLPIHCLLQAHGFASAEPTAAATLRPWAPQDRVPVSARRRSHVESTVILSFYSTRYPIQIIPIVRLFLEAVQFSPLGNIGHVFNIFLPSTSRPTSLPHPFRFPDTCVRVSSPHMYGELSCIVYPVTSAHIPVTAVRNWKETVRICFRITVLAARIWTPNLQSTKNNNIHSTGLYLQQNCEFYLVIFRGEGAF